MAARLNLILDFGEVNMMPNYALREYYRNHEITEKQKEALKKGRAIRDARRENGPVRIWRRIRKSVEETAHYVCQDCGAVQGNDLFDIHHIDKNRKNNSIKNLVLLCHMCHMKGHFRNYFMSETGRHNISEGIKKHWNIRRKKYGLTGAKNPDILSQKGTNNNIRRWHKSG